jgi:pimeloyl-ACP methyl ester carboxylesterase
MIAQGLAVKRLDLVRAMVMSNTAAKIGTAARCGRTGSRPSELRRHRGAGRCGDGALVLETRSGTTEALRMAQHARPPACRGLRGLRRAIAGTDFYTTTATLTLPTLGIAGSEDGSTPPDLVRETVDLVKGSRFHLIRGAGHLPCVEKPEDMPGCSTAEIGLTRRLHLKDALPGPRPCPDQPLRQGHGGPPARARRRACGPGRGRQDRLLTSRSRRSLPKAPGAPSGPRTASATANGRC